MNNKIPLEEVRHLQDILYLDKTGEAESVLLEFYPPYPLDDEPIDLKAVAKIPVDKIAILENKLVTLDAEIGKAYIHQLLWLYYKPTRIAHLKEVLRILSRYYSLLDFDRDSSELLYAYRFISNISSHLPRLLKEEEIEKLAEFKTFLTAYETNIESLIEEIFKESVIQQSNTPYWLIKPLFAYYCSTKLNNVDKSNFKRIVELLFGKYLEAGDSNWASHVLKEVEESCFSSLDKQSFKEKTANCFLQQGMNESGLKAIHSLRIATDLFKKLKDEAKTDESLRIMREKESTIEGQEIHISIPPDLQLKLDEFISKTKNVLDAQSKEEPCQVLLYHLLNNKILPDKASVEEQTKELYWDNAVATVTPMTAGRSGVLSSHEQLIDQQKSDLLNIMLFTYSYYKITSLLDWFLEKYGKDGLRDCLMTVYEESIIFEEDRAIILKDVIDKYLKEDMIGFVYSVIPQFEHLLKMFLLKAGINIRERNINKLEEINLCSILKNYREEIEKIFGNNFYEILWLCFLYEFGLNMRNSILHGEGLSYLNIKYSTVLFYMLCFIMCREYLKKLFNDTKAKEGEEDSGSA